MINAHQQKNIYFKVVLLWYLLRKSSCRVYEAFDLFLKSQM